MKNKVLILFSLTIVFSACRAVKETDARHEKTNTEQQTDTKETLQTNNESQGKENTHVDTETEASAWWETTTVTWSVPDSAGNQYPVETSTTKGGKNIRSKRNENTDKEERNQSEALIKKEDRSKTETSTDNKSDVKKQSKPHSEWAVWLMIALSLGLLAGVYVVLKRFKILK